MSRESERELEYALRGARIQAAELARQLPADRRTEWPEEEDLVGEAYFAVARALAGWEPARGTRWTTWAFGAVGRRLQEVHRDALRHTRTRPRPLFLEELPGCANGPWEEWLLPDARGPEWGILRTGGVLAWALSTLPARWRWVIELLFWEGLSEAETAAVLGVSASRVGQIRRQALERLRTLLDRQRDEL